MQENITNNELFKGIDFKNINNIGNNPITQSFNIDQIYLPNKLSDFEKLSCRFLTEENKMIIFNNTVTKWSDNDPLINMDYESSRIDLHNLQTSLMISYENIRNDSFNLNYYICNQVQKNLQHQKLHGFFVGNALNQPEGIMSHLNQNINNQNSNTFIYTMQKIIADNKEELYNELFQSYMNLDTIYKNQNTVWYMGSKLYNAVINDLRKYLTPQYNIANVSFALLGYPIYHSNYIDSINAEKNLYGFIGDLSKGYHIFEKTIIQCKNDPSTIATGNLLHFIQKVGGKVIDPKAIKIININKAIND